MLAHNLRWTPQKIAQRLLLIEPLVYRKSHPLPPFRYQVLAESRIEPPLGMNLDDSNWPLIEPESYWGRWETNFVLRSHFEVPAEWEADRPVALYLPLGNAGDFSHPEALAYIDGQAYAACDRHHQEIRLPDRWRDGQSHRLLLHGWTGRGGSGPHGPRGQLFMRPCAVVQIDQPTRDFIATARVALGIASNLAESEPARGHLWNALDEAFKILDTRSPFGDVFYESVGPAHEALCASIDAAGPPLDVDLIATGHAHIDVAWLWTLGQTRRKAGRTFHTVLRLMEQFPQYHFTQSQPQLYDYVRQDYPGLLEAIQERVAEGRWEPIGGMWVEADCNLTGPESLVRQFLLGRTFFREHFGSDAESPVLWLPDVFGYAWNLPQIIKGAGLDYFFTIKITWNQYNRLPYDSFWWQGVDGTQVLTHFSTTRGDWSLPGIGVRPSTYNASATPAEVLDSWQNLQQKEVQDELLMAFGYGDGGGGPTREMLENLREMAHFPATPRARQDDVTTFFRELEAGAGDALPVWNGELYFELHRGTYTTQSRNKRANRKSEFLLHDAEFVATLAYLLDDAYDYPSETLRKAWELVCLNQFHDIIPGSSIGPVYVESLEQYAEVSQLGQAARNAALQVIASKADGDLLLVNPTSFRRTDLALWPGQLGEGQRLERADGTPLFSQTTSEGTWISAGELLPYSIVPLRIVIGDTPSPESGLKVSPDLLENDYLRVELNDDGDISRIYDKVSQREVLPPDTVANQFLAFEDRPVAWDAWDIDIFYEDKSWLAEPASSIEVVEAGPLRATLEVQRRILNSEYVQRISLACNSPRLDFETLIDWRERYILLKAAFPVDVFSPVATYEIQWGNVERPTHRNTSWDWARFETAAQKWVDLSEGNYGVSLLNDCKYGHDIRDNVMRISLLRGTTSPDPEADLGQHRFTYSLFPHAGRWDERTIVAAYALNDPILVAQGQGGREEQANDSRFPLHTSLIAVDQPNIVVETIKRAEDGDGIIVRLYESQRHRGPVTLTTPFELGAVWRTNLLEENESALPVEGNQVTFQVRPYEIVTLRLVAR